MSWIGKFGQNGFSAVDVHSKSDWLLVFGKAAISVVSYLAHLGAVNALGSKRVFSDVHEMVSLKRYRLLFYCR
jgi:hypothetical protein|tara:strand:+ start:4526 stop:4744 length:219 start_codon:yes stop_codon:yes gene_type:complete